MVSLQLVFLSFVYYHKVIAGKTEIAESASTIKEERTADISLKLVMGASTRRDIPPSAVTPLPTSFPISRLCPDIAMSSFLGNRVNLADLEMVFLFPLFSFLSTP